MSHLAYYLKQKGHDVQGSDVIQDFYTSNLLENIPIYKLEEDLPSYDILIYSPAYKNKIDNLANAYSYPEYLALLSKESYTVAISGSHGKSSISAMVTNILKEIKFPSSSIFGSFLQGDELSYINNDKYLILEACEYKDHFMLYDVDILLINNIDFEHVDYFKSLKDVETSFYNRIIKTNPNGFIIYNSDITPSIQKAKQVRPDLNYIAYNSAAFYLEEKESTYLINGQYELISNDVPIKLAYNYLASLIIAAILVLKENNIIINNDNILLKIKDLVSCINSFKGLAARCEEVKKEDNILYIDDYAHHPSEIIEFSALVKNKYKRKQVCLFMPHTASRTKTFLKEFAQALASFDKIIIQNVFASARDDKDEENLSYSLYLELLKLKPSDNVKFALDDNEAVKTSISMLRENDLCITLGAGNNRKLIDLIINERKNI